jgi:hypothetical protein
MVETQGSHAQDPTVGLCLGPYGGPSGGGVSYERGTPAERSQQFARRFVPHVVSARPMKLGLSFEDLHQAHLRASVRAWERSEERSERSLK